MDVPRVTELRDLSHRVVVLLSHSLVACRGKTTHLRGEKEMTQATLTDSEFVKVAQSHLSAADHTRLAEHFAAHAAEHEKDAKVNEELAAKYETSEPRLAGESRHYAAHSREAAEAMRSLAKIHQQLAEEHHKKSHS